MTKYTYPTHDVYSANVLYDALLNNGINDAVILMNGSIEISTSFAKSLCDQAVVDATNGGLLSAKEAKKKAVSAKTTTLVNAGAETWQAGYTVDASKENMDDHQSSLTYYTSHPSELSATTPYIVYATPSPVITASVADLSLLVDNLVARLVYIYSSFNNVADGSMGEAGLLTAIANAGTIAEVNAIVDART